MSARIEKTVFISYRRVDSWPALAVFKDLTQHGFDVFIDYDGIASGDFERAIVDNIRSRAHFVVLLTPTALERCDEPGDWLRRELETAIECGRNIVPLMLDGFTFSHPLAVQRLQGSLAPLRRYQALNVPMDFFDEAMAKMRGKRLAAAVDTVLHAPSEHAARVARQQKKAASVALSDEPPDIEAPNAIDPKVSPTSESRQTRRAPPIHPPTSAAPVAASEKRETTNPISRQPVGIAIAAALVVAVAVGLATKIRGSEGASTQQAAAPSPEQPASQPTGEAVDATAQNNLGDDYFLGRNGRAQNDAAAAQWYTKAAQQGDARAQASLGYLFEMGRGDLTKDDGKAAEWYRKAADQGNDAGLNNLGLFYRQARGGLPRDDAQAVALYRKAADLGNTNAQVNLGGMYQLGAGGLPTDDAQAAEWFRKAAEHGNALGQANLGFMYEQGKGGLAKDDVQAATWYRKAAEQGDATSEGNLGILYAEGRGGLSKDDMQAADWYRKGASNGSATAQVNLGLMYEYGRAGLTKDDVKAVELYRKAAAQGNAAGQADLADMYERGAGGLEKNLQEAVRLYRLSAAQNNDYSKRALNRLGES